MNIVVIGLGSMGKRRVRLLRQYIDKEVEPSEKANWHIYGVDADAERCKEASDKYEIEVFVSPDEVLEKKEIDAVVVSTSPLSHASIINECLQHGTHVFTEINLVDDGYDENISLAKETDRVLFLSSTPIYRREMQYIINQAHERKFRGTYRYHVGQYLPEWHPWENYRDFFVGDKRTNGCRELFAIELPWLTRAYGNIADIQSLHSKTTGLNIDYDDTYQVILRHDTGVIGSLTIDVSTPKTERAFSAWEENYYVEWNGTPDTLKIMNLETKELKSIHLYSDIEHTEGYNSFVVENAYYDELREYINCIERKNKPVYGFEEDKGILVLIEKL